MRLWTLLLSTVQLVSVPCPAAAVDSGWDVPGWPSPDTNACAGTGAGAGAEAGPCAAATAAGGELSPRARPVTADRHFLIALGPPVG